jgi:hypothetical protein
VKFVASSDPIIICDACCYKRRSAMIRAVTRMRSMADVPDTLMNEDCEPEEVVRHVIDCAKPLLPSSVPRVNGPDSAMWCSCGFVRTALRGSDMCYCAQIERNVILDDRERPHYECRMAA